MNWIGNGIPIMVRGEFVNAELGQGGFFLTLAGRILNPDGTLGGYFAHPRPNRWWYASQEEAMTALNLLAAQETAPWAIGPSGKAKPEINLRKPGVVEAFAFVEPRPR